MEGSTFRLKLFSSSLLRVRELICGTRDVLSTRFSLSLSQIRGFPPFFEASNIFNPRYCRNPRYHEVKCHLKKTRIVRERKKNLRNPPPSRHQPISVDIYIYKIVPLGKTCSLSSTKRADFFLLFFINLPYTIPVSLSNFRYFFFTLAKFSAFIYRYRCGWELNVGGGGGRNFGDTIRGWRTNFKE